MSDKLKLHHQNIAAVMRDYFREDPVMEYDKIAAALSAKLHPDTVKSRRQGGAQVSYIEGWRRVAD